MSPTRRSQTHDNDEKDSANKRQKAGSDGSEPHQHQAGTSTDREEDQWKFRPPYLIQRGSRHGEVKGSDEKDDKFEVHWRGKCHCGRVQYELGRDRPLASKYCHCTTCQRLHGAPFQWAAIFHKQDINFLRGHHDLGWYDPTTQSQTHHLPCKVQCAFCRTPIMDEGRNMILLFPTLIEGINSPEGRDAFKAQCHMFYPQRVVDIEDDLPKWKGLEKHSELVGGTEPRE